MHKGTSLIRRLDPYIPKNFWEIVFRPEGSRPKTQKGQGFVAPLPLLRFAPNFLPRRA